MRWRTGVNKFNILDYKLDRALHKSFIYPFKAKVQQYQKAIP